MNHEIQIYKVECSRKSRHAHAIETFPSSCCPTLTLSPFPSVFGDVLLPCYFCYPGTHTNMSTQFYCSFYYKYTLMVKFTTCV